MNMTPAIHLLRSSSSPELRPAYMCLAQAVKMFAIHICLIHRKNVYLVNNLCNCIAAHTEQMPHAPTRTHNQLQMSSKMVNDELGYPRMNIPLRKVYVSGMHEEALCIAAVALGSIFGWADFLGDDAVAGSLGILLRFRFNYLCSCSSQISTDGHNCNGMQCEWGIRFITYRSF